MPRRFALAANVGRRARVPSRARFESSLVCIDRTVMPAAQHSELVRKALTRGSHRCRSVEETLQRLEPWAARAGITRVANLTGLDTIGLPVVSVTRPNARSQVISFGRGLDLPAATAAGLMEALATHHAEHVSLPLRLSSARELRSKARIAEFSAPAGPARQALLGHDPALWVEGVALPGGESVWVPYARVVELGLEQDGAGLAAGNHLLEAISHGLCALIERDVRARLIRAGGLPPLEDRVDLHSIDDPDCQYVLELLHAADIACGVWNMTGAIGLATCACLIVDQRAEPQRPRLRTLGVGCHPAREIALLRALGGALQQRTMHLAGARDDVDQGAYQRARDPERTRSALQWIAVAARSPQPTQRADFRTLPSRRFAALDDDVAWVLACLQSVGLDETLAVDLTQPELGLPVVRVIVPGLGLGTDELGDAQALLRPARGRAS